MIPYTMTDVCTAITYSRIDKAPACIAIDENGKAHILRGMKRSLGTTMKHGPYLVVVQVIVEAA